MQQYEKYKDSGVDWIGEIPEGWFQEPFSSVFSLKSIVNNKNEELLSVYLDKGVIRFSDVGEKRTNVTSEDLSKYQLVEEGDFVLNNQQAWRGSVGVSFYRGIVSPAYIVLAVKNNFDFRFLNYLLRNRSFVTHYLLCSKGVGTIQRNLYWPQLKRVYLIFPSLEEQRTIAMFLDDKTAIIDKTITIKEKEIELLKERRQILIQKAVTRGLDDTVKVKDSGVDWIGEIPEHWEVRKLKYLIKELNERSSTGQEELLSLSKFNGIIPKSSLEERAGGAESHIGYKVVRKDDLVINKMQAVNGLLAVSKISGITSPDYSVYYSKDPENLNIYYLQYLLLQIEYLSEFKKRVTGVMEGFIRLYTDDLYDIKIHVPKVQEQNEIVSYIMHIETKIVRAIFLKQQEIEKLKEYKTVLIDNVVTGKVRVS